jgi:hypothetical protein
VLRIAMLLLVAAISTAQAQEERTAMGPIGFSCGKGINAPKHTGEHAQLRQWVLGYLFGINMQSGADFLRD